MLSEERHKLMSHVCVHLRNHKRARGGKTCDADCNACSHTVCTEECTGCLSDPAGVDINFNRECDESKKPNYYTGRGSSQLENLHRVLGKNVLSSVCGPFRCHNLMLATVYDWNIDRRCQNCESGSSLPLPLQHRQPALLRINSYAASAQQRLQTRVELPFQHVRAPTCSIDVEKLGCECHTYPTNLLSADADRNIPTGGTSGQTGGGDPNEDDNNHVQQRRVRARGDGRCALRAILHAVGAEALTGIGLSPPPGMDLLLGNDQATWAFIRHVRVAAVAKLEAELAADSNLLSMVEATFPDDMYLTLDAWLAAMKSDESTQAVSTLWHGGGTWHLYALAKLFGVQMVITSYHPNGGGLQPIGAPIDVAMFGPNVIHLAQVHDDDGTPNHFDLLVDDYSLGNGPANAEHNPTPASASAPSISTALRQRQTGIDFLQSIAGLGALHPEPIYDKPSREGAPDPSKDERTLFDSMYQDYNRQDHSRTSKRSYAAFAEAWTVRAVQESGKRLRGEAFLQLRLKTKADLTAWYDRLQEVMASADAMSPADIRDAQMLRYDQLQSHVDAPSAVVRPAPPVVVPPTGIQQWGGQYSGHVLPTLNEQSTHLQGVRVPPPRQPNDPLHAVAPLLMPAPTPVIPNVITTTSSVDKRRVCVGCGGPCKERTQTGKTPHQL